MELSKLGGKWMVIYNSRNNFPHDDPVDRFTVFNIKKNEYRLITVIPYNCFKVN